MKRFRINGGNVKGDNVTIDIFLCLNIETAS